MKTKFYSCDDTNELCKFIDSHPGIVVLGFSQDRVWRTVYYQENDGLTKELEKLVKCIITSVPDFAPDYDLYAKEGARKILELTSSNNNS